MLRLHFGTVMRWRNRRLWLLAIESSASLLWVVTLALSLIATALALLTGAGLGVFGYSLAWGIAIAVVATMQLAFALGIDFPYDRRAAITFLIGPLYPIAYWMISAAAALRCETVGLLRGPSKQHVTWDIPRARSDVESGV